MDTVHGAEINGNTKRSAGGAHHRTVKFRGYVSLIERLDKARGSLSDLPLSKLRLTDNTLRWLTLNEIETLGQLTDVAGEIKNTFLYEWDYLDELIDAVQPTRLAEATESAEVLYSLETVNSAAESAVEKNAAGYADVSRFRITFFASEQASVVIKTVGFSVRDAVSDFLNLMPELRGVFKREEDGLFIFDSARLRRLNASYDAGAVFREIVFSDDGKIEITALKFTDGEDIAVDIFERLRSALQYAHGYIALNDELRSVKRRIAELDPVLQNVKIKRLFGSNLIDGRGLDTLSDILNMEIRDFGYEKTREILECVQKRTASLVFPGDVLREIMKSLSPMQRIVLKRRYFYSPKTLSETGSEFGITRERVRQIENKSAEILRSPPVYEKVESLMNAVMTLSGSRYCVSRSELKKYRVPADLFIWFAEAILRANPILPKYAFADLIPYADERGEAAWIPYVQNRAKEFPAVILPRARDGETANIVSRLNERGYELTGDVVKKLAFEKYTERGNALVKKSIRLGDSYQVVLERYFPDGISLYKPEELARFRKCYKYLFDDDKVDAADRAVISRIAGKCTLVGRGRYVLRKDVVLPPALKNDIHGFISEYPYDMVMTNSVLHRFKAELSDAGIDNKYYLSAVLRQNFHNEFTYRRDYVVKGNATGNFYSIIYEFIRKHKRGVGLAELKSEFAGTPEPLLYFALTSGDEIISTYNKVYVHKDNITFEEKDVFLDFLKSVTEKEKIVSDAKIFNLAKKYFKDFLLGNNIGSERFLYGVLRAFFSDEFRFSRPHIIDLSVDSANGYEALKDIFLGNDYVPIDDIKKLAKEKDIIIYDTVKLLNSYNDKFYILNKKTLVAIEKLELDSDVSHEIEKLALQALNGRNFAEIEMLNLNPYLPAVSTGWTDWLIYSLLNKYAAKLAVITSAPKFDEAVPVVIRADTDAESVREIFTISNKLPAGRKTDGFPI
ncbi:MAG: hypothetical protein LBP79_00225 [Clostridiales bacterium]|jgi:hypothetical protein|nr:hypothetical protein [Clostridiales bacterium]